MEDFKNNSKILFIPGWLDNGARHGYQNSLDVWHKKIDISRNFKADYVIAHSIGSLIALHNWQLYKNFKIILINPVISSGNIIGRWYKFSKSEEIPDSFKKIIKIIGVAPSLLKAFKLFKVPALDIISIMPNEKLVIVYGEHDVHLFDSKVVEQIKEKGIKVIKVKGSGHNYDENIERAVLENIKLI